jgi:folate-binding protein YgfZ
MSDATGAKQAALETAAVTFARRAALEQAPGFYAAAPGRSLLRLWGADTIPFLQTKLTQDTRPWPARGGGYATATDINGRILFDLQAFAWGERGWLLVLEEGRAESALAHFDRYLISEKVELELLDEALSVVALGGAEVAARLGLEPLAEGQRTAEPWRDGWLLRGTGLDPADALLVLPREGVAEALEALAALGLEAASGAEFDALRLAAGRARIGFDDGASALPLELGLWEAMSFRKGCYLGQEIIERLFSRSTPARRLMRLASPVALAPGTPVLAGEEVVGTVTGVVAASEGVLALGLLKRTVLDGSVALTAGGAPLTILGFVGGERPAQV